MLKVCYINNTILSVQKLVFFRILPFNIVERTAQLEETSEV